MRYILFSKFVLLALIMTGCHTPDPEKPGIEYAPNMYHPVSYHPLKVYEREPMEHNPKGKHMWRPVEGTIARGKLGYYYPFPDSPEGYEEAGTYLRSPLNPDEKVIAEGQRLYNIYCAVCHGQNGSGDGPVASKEPGDGLMPAIPKFYEGRVSNISEGHIYHVITYGRNLMGSHASQLTPEQRWKVVHYVQKLQGKDLEASDQNNDTNNNYNE